MESAKLNLEYLLVSLAKKTLATGFMDFIGRWLG